MDKKYKYAIKKFAKLLTVHPDKRVTFQDTIDVRELVRLDSSFQELILETGLDRPRPACGFSGILSWLSHLEVEDITNKEDAYWESVTEHGMLLREHDGRIAFGYVKTVVPPFGLQIEHVVPPENVAAWLAATGFPQISRAKEETPPA